MQLIVLCYVLLTINIVSLPKMPDVILVTCKGNNFRFTLHIQRFKIDMHNRDGIEIEQIKAKHCREGRASSELRVFSISRHRLNDSIDFMFTGRRLDCGNEPERLNMAISRKGRKIQLKLLPAEGGTLALHSGLSR